MGHLSPTMTDSAAAQPPLGFLAVEVDIFRPPGDPYNDKTWPFPLIREKVTGTSESQIVTSTAYDDAFIERFVAAGQRLAERGAVGIITSCGFLAMAQKRYLLRSASNSRELKTMTGWQHVCRFLSRHHLSCKCQVSVPLFLQIRPLES